LRPALRELVLVFTYEAKQRRDLVEVRPPTDCRGLLIPLDVAGIDEFGQMDVVELGREEFEIVIIGREVVDRELSLVTWIVLADEQENPTPIRMC
jgi:hypothetical protein